MIEKKRLDYIEKPTGSGGSDISDTTATASDVLSPKDFYLADGTKTRGTIPTYNGSTSVTPTEQAQTLPTDDKYVTENITVGAIPSQYKDTTGTDAVAGDILAGKKAVTSAGVVTGSIPTYDGAVTVTQNGTLAVGGKYCPSNVAISVPGTTNKLQQVVMRASNITITESDLAGITKVGSYAFGSHSSATHIENATIIVPSTVIDVASYAFAYMPGSKIFFKSKTPPTVATSSFNPATGNTATVYVPYQSINEYRTQTNWTTLDSNSRLFGYSDENTFTAGETLPVANDEGFGLTWYSDAAMTTQVTTVSDPSQKYYCSAGSTYEVEVQEVDFDI